MATLEVRLGRVDKTYRPGDRVTGTVCIRGVSAPVAHSGLVLHATGVVSPQVASGGVFSDASTKPIALLDTVIDMAPAGKLPPDVPLPFEFALAPLQGRALADTYHGVYVSVKYSIAAALARSGFLAKALEGDVEFVVEVPLAERPAPKAVDFEVRPESLDNVKKGSMGAIPKFAMKGRLNRTNCPLNAPFTGEITVLEAAARIRSIELQLVRVETIKTGATVARETTEIQNLQVGDGNCCRNLAIPLYMVLPRIFTCPTVITDTFRVEFEVRRGRVGDAVRAPRLPQIYHSRFVVSFAV